MSDDLVKRARHNALADMPHHASVELIEALADRIEKLEYLLGGAETVLEAWDRGDEADFRQAIEEMRADVEAMK